MTVILKLVTVLVTTVGSKQFQFSRVGQCSSNHQQTAIELHTQHRCNTREELVELELPSDGSVIQV